MAAIKIEGNVTYCELWSVTVPVNMARFVKIAASLGYPMSR